MTSGAPPMGSTGRAIPSIPPGSRGSITTSLSSTGRCGSWRGIRSRAATETTSGIPPMASTGTRCRTPRGSRGTPPACSSTTTRSGWWPATIWSRTCGSCGGGAGDARGGTMEIEVSRVEVNEILPLRELYRQEMNCQIVHDSFPRRGFSDAYLIRMGSRIAAYGLVANRHSPDTVNEFYPLPDYRAAALPLFRQLLEVSQATKIRTQTNDRLMLL